MILGLILLLGASAAPAPEPASVERHLEMMGTRLRILVEAADRTAALAASEAAVRALEETEARLSTWIPDSELSRVNAAPAGETVELSPALAVDLGSVSRFHGLTRGRFDPTIGTLARVWSLRTGGSRPSPGELRRARARTGWGELLELDGKRLRKLGDVIFEEGGFGKGVGLDRALAAARDAGATGLEIDLGGQLLVSGTSRLYGVAHPERRSQAVVEVRLDAGSLATTGNSERGIVVDGARRSHILDPATGVPAPDWGSLTVWASSATAADACSTGLYLLGPDAALAVAAREADLEALALERRSGGIRVRATPGLRGRLRALPGAPIASMSFVKPGADSGLETEGDGEQYAVEADGSPSPVTPSPAVAAADENR